MNSSVSEARYALSRSPGAVEHQSSEAARAPRTPGGKSSPLRAAPNTRSHASIFRAEDRLIATLHIADTWPSRLRGLMFRPPLAEDGSEALLLTPCSSVHTFGMRYPLDLVYLDRDGSVLEVQTNVRPSRMSMKRGAHSTLELHAGAASRLGIAPGQRLRWEAA